MANYVHGPPNAFFLENALKKATEYFLKYLFLFESTILPVNNGKQVHSNGCLGWPYSSLHDRSNFFHSKVQSFRLIMENNLIQMAASAGHTVA